MLDGTGPCLVEEAWLVFHLLHVTLNIGGLEFNRLVANKTTNFSNVQDIANGALISRVFHVYNIVTFGIR